MHDTKWENLIFMIEEKFGVSARSKGPIEIEQDSKGEGIFGEIESIEFKGPVGQMKIERISRPKVVDKKVLSTKRIGGKVAVDYVYSDDEKVQDVKLYKKNEDDEWQEIDPGAMIGDN